MSRVRADLAGRPGAPVGRPGPRLRHRRASRARASATSASAASPSVPLSAFDGRRLRRARPPARRPAAGRPGPLQRVAARRSRSPRSTTRKQVLLVDLGRPAGRRADRRVAADAGAPAAGPAVRPARRPAHRPRGGPAYESHYLQVTLTDPVRPREPMERLRAPVPARAGAGVRAGGRGAPTTGRPTPRGSAAAPTSRSRPTSSRTSAARPSRPRPSCCAAAFEDVPPRRGGRLMRLHRLEVTAFGPFAGTETVDFDALADGRPVPLHRRHRRRQDERARRRLLRALRPGPRRPRPAPRSLRSDHAAEGVGAARSSSR